MRSPRSTRVLVEPEGMGRPFVAPVVLPVEVEDDSEELDDIATDRERARQEGYREGRLEAERELEHELERVRTRVVETLKHLADLECELTRRHENLLLEIAIDAASRIVRERLEAGDPMAARALAEALMTLPAAATVRARLNPADLERVADRVRGEVDAGRIELVADADISPGGVLVMSAVGNVDARLETAMAAVREAALGDGEAP